MGSVYKRGNRYWIKYRDEKTGELIRKSAGTTRLEALAALRKEAPTPPGVPFAELVDVYLTSLRSRAKARSIAVTQSSCNRLLEHFGLREANSLTDPDLDQFISRRKAEGVKARTINGDLIVLRATLNHAVRTRALESLPVRVRLLRAPKKRVLPILSVHDIRRLLANARDPYYGILLISAHTGFRLSETLNLTWGDVLWSEEKLAITGKNGWSPKTYEERSAFVPPMVLDYLRHRRQQVRFRGDQHYVFSTRNRTTPSVHNVCRAVRKIFKQTGLYREDLPLTHWIRHSVASRLLGDGVDVETVRTLLGHADATTTLRYYAHSCDSRMRAASEKLRLQLTPVRSPRQQEGVPYATLSRLSSGFRSVFRAIVLGGDQRVRQR